MSRAKARRRPKATATDAPSLAKRADAARRNIFKAMSIVACYRLACASLIANNDPELSVQTLQATHDFLDDAAEEIEAIADEHGDDADWEVRS